MNSSKPKILTFSTAQLKQFPASKKNKAPPLSRNLPLHFAPKRHFPDFPSSIAKYSDPGQYIPVTVQFFNDTSANYFPASMKASIN
jgi:hypothetical protein